ncbi:MULTISPECIES: leucyl/phenylalanyl-tRNA--protein transferase [Paracoccus]|jgi:leucyl/phenylalanyl-tRNA--protein transferase|uniref:Leucyl/phenylalanyl-tRNA--protein transferase n=1 Tax=Paracoccus denitrificans (strain Pd 1222) TaxID=318586 RepID=LFTR_PARDP|nr:MULTISPECIES: leucyl/phenylalanyl-tRNA--protein transferase [Paracoccus]A1B1I1.1 RecName: Full=Leucyl/phenylalanyl-tRNA--protein transferase; AltName: Full=L/F-transferase; AltName: Full=Leucyltransferase; AltName: Full=Phenyalanyltransferase [Paracoccus denitrificans PD1222]ABL69375.1 Leucyltransferase [Paracoccus denitrificans PD1222]MBB4629163.1 leucyl/phenylalanyl-tRNA--protein transferase [Paracoccus denitrificans]MCU7430120.1 leucyl/phenylalanyl-tRNA--protein transferase [Paracoccus de
MSGGLTAERMLAAYAQGVFPMAESASAAQLYWFEPALRGILPVGGVHVSRSMRRFLRHCDWRATIDNDFAGVVAGCADREETWINAPLLALYQDLFRMGHAHSLEIRAGEDLIGGMFGLTLGGAFFAESMFSRRSNASKAALIWMSSHLARCGFTLWDTQYPNPHLASMGGRAIPRLEYRRRLAAALRIPADFTAHALPDVQALLQEITQTS